MAPRFSVVVPFYMGLAHIGECVCSVLRQDFSSLEVIIVDDCSPDGSGKLLGSMFSGDSRVSIIRRANNGGTLRARRDGVLASTGDYVLLLDQDDCFVEGALSAIDKCLRDATDDLDIVHFGVSIVAENAMANDAREGMRGFLTPKPRLLRGSRILEYQFRETDGFDWHVHHKVFRGELARSAWALAEDTPLSLSDDLYVSFILCSLSTSYLALDNSPWYEYHLGRGETLSGGYSFASFERTCKLDARAMDLLKLFVRKECDRLARNDWEMRLSDVRDRLIEHVMNELNDNLSAKYKSRAVRCALEMWPADAVAGELWRFVRDRAYCLFDRGLFPDAGDELGLLVRRARYADRLVVGDGSDRYQSMRKAAHRHLRDLVSLATPRQKVFSKLFMRWMYE